MRRQLCDTISLMEENRGIVQEETVKKLKEIRKDFLKDCNDFKAELQPAITDVRAGNKEMDSISELLKTFIEKDFSPENIEIKLNEFETDIERIKSIEEMEKYTSLKKLHFTFIGKENTISISEQIGKSFIMYMNVDNQEENVRGHFQKLMNISESVHEKDKPIFFWADCPRAVPGEEEKENIIEERMDSIITFQNLMTAEKECFVRIPQQAQEICLKDFVSRHKVPLKIKCPSSLR